MKKQISVLVSLTVLLYGCSKINSDFSLNEAMMLGGAQTVVDEFSSAYSHAFHNLSSEQHTVHEVGDVAFEATFVTAPAPRNSGLGPLYNQVSCFSCHVNDGRGKLPNGTEAGALLFRISMPGQGPHGEPLPVPGFGDQLQNKAIQSTLKEAEVNITYQTITESYPDGTLYHLYKPNYQIQQPYLPLPSGYLLSPRIASPVFGLGLLEAIPESAILAHADEHDANGDGISGRANYVFDLHTQSKQLGRFGWKANQPSILQQVAAAYNGDMGVTTSLFPKENSYLQLQDDLLQDDHELSDSLLYAVKFYIQTLAVPAARQIKLAEVQQGKVLFAQIGCGSCHIANYTTADNVAFPAISHQRIQPYTDLLLHDMGSELADHRPDYLATGTEWRTPPLWGIGLAGIVNGNTYYLHDGRAKSLEEAILWHGGEGERSKQQFKQLPASARKQLLTFLKNL